MNGISASGQNVSKYTHLYKQIYVNIVYTSKYTSDGVSSMSCQGNVPMENGGNNSVSVEEGKGLFLIGLLSLSLNNPSFSVRLKYTVLFHTVWLFLSLKVR